LRSLGPRHHAAIRLKLDGASGSEIADALDVQTRTVYLWMGDPLVKEELARQLDRIGDEFTRQVALAANTAITELRKMAELPVEGPLETSEKLAVIQQILERYSAPNGPADRANSFERELESLSDAELLAQAKELTERFFP
jgi:hypothetical protein